MTTHRKAPGPRLPFDIRRYRADAAAIMLDLHRTYGDVVRFRVGPQLAHQITAPELIRHVLHDKDSYRRGKVYGGFDLFLGKGMLTADSELWRVRRRIGQPHLRAGRIGAAIPVIAAAVDDLLGRWETHAAEGFPVDITPEAMRLALDVVARTLFGSGLRHHAESVVAAGPAVLSAMFPGSLEQLLPSWLPTPVRRRLRTVQAVFDAAAEELIEQHLTAAGPADDLLGALCGAGDPATGTPLTKQQIADELKTYLWAGYETTGCGLTWTLFEIARHPAVYDRLRAELNTVLGNRTPDAVDLPRLRYLRQVIDESLRLHPPIPLFPREPVRDIEIGGYRIPSGSTVFVSSQAVQRDPRHWPDPERFDPDRFGPGSTKPLPYTYFPFGGGARRCIGAPLAELELTVAVAMIVQRFRLARSPEHPVDEHFLISLRPRPGLLLTVSSVSSAQSRPGIEADPEV